MRSIQEQGLQYVLLLRLATHDGDIMDLGVGADQFTVAIISQGKNPGKSPCEKSCCWLSNCYMLRLSRIHPPGTAWPPA